MARLIDATRIEQYILNNCSDNEEINAIYAEIINAPTVDAEPVKHGHWNEAKDGTLWCSVCTSTGPYDEDSWGYVIHAPHYDYCPHCGAKMDEVEE